MKDIWQDWKWRIFIMALVNASIYVVVELIRQPRYSVMFDGIELLFFMLVVGGIIVTQIVVYMFLTSFNYISARDIVLKVLFYLNIILIGLFFLMNPW